MGRFEWKLDVPNPRQDLEYVSSFDVACLRRIDGCLSQQPIPDIPGSHDHRQVTSPRALSSLISFSRFPKS
jgi:hypothetical protein